MMEAAEDFNMDDYMDDDFPLPGFRFHPTDEELVGFYLRRKLDEKPLSIELIKQIDIYKYDPWDLPKASSRCGEKEGYFFCKRGRKYRNSIRPNRVTGSGFWKATGIDKPVYSLGGEGHDCIGLKKTLVYYRGSAGKGTKTDWMMHEFRLPSENDITHTNLVNSKNNTTITQEAEVWTLCRIFKRNVSHKKFTSDLRQTAAKRQSIEKSTTAIRTTMEDSNIINQESYVSFGGSSFGNYHSEHKPLLNYTNDPRNQCHVSHLTSSSVAQPQLVAPNSNMWMTDSAANDLFMYKNWDELGSVVKFAIDSYGCD